MNYSPIKKKSSSQDEKIYMMNCYVLVQEIKKLQQQITYYKNLGQKNDDNFQQFKKIKKLLQQKDITIHQLKASKIGYLKEIQILKIQNQIKQLILKSLLIQPHLLENKKQCFNYYSLIKYKLNSLPLNLYNEIKLEFDQNYFKQFRQRIHKIKKYDWVSQLDKYLVQKIQTIFDGNFFGPFSKLKTQQKNKLMIDLNQQKINHQEIIQYLTKIYGQDSKHIEEKYYHQLKKTTSLINIYKNKYKISLEPDAYIINHKNKKIQNMKNFIEIANYSHINWIDFKNCQIKDSQFKIFIQNAERFSNLKILFLSQNKLQNIKIKDLQAFESLKYLSLQGNPLTNESIRELKTFKANKSPFIIWISIDGVDTCWK